MSMYCDGRELAMRLHGTGWISNAKVKNGVVWGLGGAFLLPTATDDLLGTKKWAAGPTAILLKQSNGWTYGALVNQIWSVAGDEEATVTSNQMYLQPFVTYNWKSGTGLTVNTELTQNWEASTTTAFVNIMAGGLLRFGGQLVQVQVGPRIPGRRPRRKQSGFRGAGCGDLRLPESEGRSKKGDGTP